MSNSVRNIAGATVRFESDDPGIVYSVVAVPSLQLKEGSQSQLEAKLIVTLARSDFSPQTTGRPMPVGAGEIELARMDTGDSLAFAGPDWPAVAILPTGQVAIAWTQPAADASRSELHLQRYKMCLPAE